jgi:SET domain-containing protein
MPKASQSYFEIRSSSIQGRGAFATRRIRKGTRLIEYVGERISHAEADRRYDDDTMRRHHTFLFTLNNRTVLDAAVNGNEARFINHSCDPNCEAWIEGRKIFIYSLRDIAEGEELTFDYGFDVDCYEDHPCRCGSGECIGFIVSREQWPELKNRLAGRKK